MSTATLIAGVPSINKALFHQIRFDAHDPASLIVFPDGKRLIIMRDVELARAKTEARADEVVEYATFTPGSGLSGDREIASAQSVAECMKQHGITNVISDRTLPLVYVDELVKAGIGFACDQMLGVTDRRQKDKEEVEALRTAQLITESAIRMACELIAKAKVNDQGELLDPDREGEVLTSERVKALIDMHLSERGCVSDGHIVAGGPIGADCHHAGAGTLRTGEPVLVDVFPRHLASGYHGDCTRTVVHGDIPGVVAKMHDAVARAKAASIASIKAGVTGEEAHKAAIDVLTADGYALTFAPDDAPPDFTSMPHGTGHGLGLDLKEPPLLDFKGPELLVGDAVTVEPALYRLDTGGVRLEDLVIVTADGCENLNTLPEGLTWE